MLAVKPRPYNIKETLHRSDASMSTYLSEGKLGDLGMRYCINCILP